MAVLGYARASNTTRVVNRVLGTTCLKAWNPVAEHASGRQMKVVSRGSAPRFKP